MNTNANANAKTRTPNENANANENENGNANENTNANANQNALMPAVVAVQPPAPGKLTVAITPWCDLTVDGVARGRAPLTSSCPPARITWSAAIRRARR